MKHVPLLSGIAFAAFMVATGALPVNAQVYFGFPSYGAPMATANAMPNYGNYGSSYPSYSNYSQPSYSPYSMPSYSTPNYNSYAAPSYNTTSGYSPYGYAPSFGTASYPNTSYPSSVSTPNGSNVSVVTDGTGAIHINFGNTVANTVGSTVCLNSSTQSSPNQPVNQPQMPCQNYASVGTPTGYGYPVASQTPYGYGGGYSGYSPYGYGYSPAPQTAAYSSGGGTNWGSVIGALAGLFGGGGGGGGSRTTSTDYYYDDYTTEETYSGYRWVPDSGSSYGGNGGGYDDYSDYINYD